MKKNYFVKAVVYLITMLAACLLNLAISALLVKFVDVLIAPEFLVFAVVRAISGIFSGCLVLGIIVWYESYKSVSFSYTETLIPFGMAAAAHFLLAFLLRFYPFVAGGTRYLAGVLDLGDHFDYFESVSDIRLWAYVAAFFIGKAVEMIAIVICGKIGVRSRLKNRETIKGYPQT